MAKDDDSVMHNPIANDPMARLELVQALRLPTTAALKKIELAYTFVEQSVSMQSAGAQSGSSDSSAGFMKMPQFFSFISEWVQSALIKSSKPGETTAQQEEIPAYLDTRYWAVLKFCLVSGFLHPFTSVSPTLMRSLTSAISVSPSQPLVEELILVVDVLFHEFDRPFRSNLESWVTLTIAALSLLKLEEKSDSLRILISLVVEGFSRTVATHPNPSKVFQAIIARLVEPLLQVVGESVSSSSISVLENRVVFAAQEILGNGLFHSAHVGGYAEVCVFLRKRKEKNSIVDANSTGKKDSESRQRSYHRMFFQKLEEFRKAGNLVVLTGLGRVFKMYAQRLKAQRAALSEDIYGVRGQGKPQTAESTSGGEAKPIEQPGEEEGEKDEDNATPYVKKQANETDTLFTVFAELLGPLKSELEDLTRSNNVKLDASQPAEALVIQISSLMVAVTELLEAAKEVKAYKSLEDTPASTYLGFLQEVHNTIVKVGNVAFDIWSNVDVKAPVAKKKKRLSGLETRGRSKKEIELLSRKMIFSLRHLLELDYRVFEEHLAHFWLFVFKMVASNEESERTTQEALELGQGLLIMYSDLRQVDIPIYFLTNSLTLLQNSIELDILSSTVEKIVCAKLFLVTLGSVIQKLPEGQVTQLLRRLTEAVTKTLETVETQDKSKSKIFGSSLKGLVEVYTCIVENANVSASNSVPVAGAIRELLTKVLGPSLTKLVDKCTQIEDNTENNDESNAEEEDDSVCWKSLLLLTLYSASRMLHRQCVSLMPPKAAKKAKASVFEPEVDLLSATETDTVSYLEQNGFLMSLHRGSVKMSKLLRKLEQKIGTKWLLTVPAVGHTLSTIALQSLVDLDQNIQATRYVIANADSTKKLLKALRSLEREGAKLVAFMLDGLDNIGQEYTLSSLKWDKVMATLDSKTVLISRWCLLCATTDVWSQYASEDDLKEFVVTFLRIGRACKLNRKMGECTAKIKEESDPTSIEDDCVVDLDGITWDLLTNLEFFENEDIRQVFASSFLQELKVILLVIFEGDRPIFSIFDQCIESTTPVTTTETTNAEFVEKVKSTMSSQQGCAKSGHQDLCWTNDQANTFGHCIGLLKLLVHLPYGYLRPADIARFAYPICELEKLLVDVLLGKYLAAKSTSKSSQKKAARVLSSPSHVVLANALVGCHSALEFLTNSLTTSNPNIKKSEFLRILFGDSPSTQCLTLLPETLSSCLQKSDHVLRSSFQINSGATEGTSPGMLLSVHNNEQESSTFVFALMKRTCAVIEASLGNICVEDAKLLVCPKPSLDMADLGDTKSRKKSKKLKGPLSVFESVFAADIRNLEVLLKAGDFSSSWIAPLTTIAAISSCLWSMTKALENVDEECRNSKSTPIVWRKELPESWLHIIMELEPVLVRILIHLLFPTGAAGLGFLMETRTKTREVADADLEDNNPDEVEDVNPINQDTDMMDEDLGEVSSDEDSPEKDTTVEEDGLENEEHEAEVIDVQDSFHLLESSLNNVTEGSSSSSQFGSLRSILEEKDGDKSKLVGELYMAIAAVVKLRGLFSSPFAFALSLSPSSPNFSYIKDVPPPFLDTLLLASYWLLSGSVQRIPTQKMEKPRWLVGVVQYMGSVGAYLPCMKPFISPIDFIKLINLHIELLGALTPLRDDPWTETETETADNLDDDSMGETLETADWDLNNHDFRGPEGRRNGSDSTISKWSAQLEFAVRKSFESLLKYAPRQHMVLALQSVEKAMSGVWGGSNRGSGLEVTNAKTCEVGTVVASGVECLSLSLQAVSGKMRLHLLASHCPAFLGGLFNLLGHMQGPSLFCERHQNSKFSGDRLRMVSAAPVVLCSVEVLTTLAARAVIFPMKANFVALALQSPALLFRPFHEFGKPKSVVLLQSSVSRNEIQQRRTFVQTFNEKSVKLYIACCRLLCALLRHRLRECGHSMALLGESCRVLLQCLTAPSWTETTDEEASISITGKAAQCGSWLCRVYEEMGKQKETMGKYCSHLLADYLNVLSGHSLGGIGLKREVDSALRPGAFALLDACSGNDLQQLHAALGEGARRSALMTLRHDFDLHYKYTGKV